MKLLILFLSFFTVLAIPMLIASVARYRITGWIPAYSVQIILVVIFLACIPFLNRLGRNFKAFMAIFLLCLGFAVGLYNLGYFGSGKLFMIPGSLIAVFLIGRRQGYIIFTLFLIIFIGFAILYINKTLTYNFQLIDYINQPMVWISNGITLALITLGLMFVINIIDDSQKSFVQSIARSEENYRALFEQNLDGIIISNREGGILEVNNRLLELLGYSQEDIVGQGLHDLFPEEDLENYPFSFEMLTKGMSIENTLRMKGKNGDLMDVDIRANSLMDGRVQIFVQDLSNRVESEKKLMESEQRYQTLFNHANDAIFLVKDMKFFDCNPKVLEIFGCEFDDIIGFGPAKFSPEFQPDGRRSDETAEERLAKVLTGESQVFVWSHCKLNGDLFDAEVSLNSYEMSGTKFILGIVRDITEKKQLSRKVFMASQTAEENERERLARDLHDGLGPLLSASKIYLHNIKGGQDLKEVATNSLKLEQILDEALSGIKEISNNISPHILRNFGLVQAVKSYTDKVDMFLPVHIDSTLDKAKRFPEAIEVTVYRIICELVNNSIKYAEATALSLHLEESNNKLKVFYQDDGKGFDYKDVFENTKGHGLLNIQSRIDALNGQYAFETNPGEGVKVNIEMSI